MATKYEKIKEKLRDQNRLLEKIRNNSHKRHNSRSNSKKKENETEKAKHQTHYQLNWRRVLYHCATTVTP